MKIRFHNPLAAVLAILCICEHLVFSEESDCFSYSDNFLSVDEDTSVGETIAYLNSEGTAGGSNSTILHLGTMDGSDVPCTEYVVLDEEMQAINLTKALDRDEPVGIKSISCKLTCTDRILGFQVDYIINFHVEDVNDNYPYFVGELPYHTAVSELEDVGTIIFRVSAEDPDSGGAVSYYIRPNPDDPESNESFSISLPSIGDIKLTKTLDYESKKEWRILVEAKDRDQVDPKSTTTILTVTVQDGDDQGPQFLPCIRVDNVCAMQTYTTHIQEKQNITGFFEFSPGPIFAIDQDVNISTEIIYSFLQGSPPEYIDYFEIHPHTGNITLKTPVDRGLFQFFSLTIKAQEGTNTARYQTANVDIYIDDVNDNKPVFLETSYSGFVKENSAVSTTVVTTATGTSPLQIIAVDLDIDEGVSPQLEYKFIGADGWFSPSKIGDTLYVVVSGELDREMNTSFFFWVVAMETTTEETMESDPVAITVTLLDENDNYPIFAGGNNYRVMVKEDAIVGSVILSLTASDEDLGDNGIIDFSITHIANGASDLFNINQTNATAVITLAKSELEARKEYTITVMAKDRGPENNQKSTLAFVTVDVIPSLNARKPVFTENPFHASVSESALPGNVFETVTATDADGDTLHYNITGGDPDNEFSINEFSGEVSITTSLNRERQSLYILTVSATDLNQTVTTELIVTVLDINDNNPIFNSTWPSVFSILEGQIGIVGQVQAYDLDEPNTVNSQVEYTLTSDKFNISPQEGVISTIVALDREQQSVYELVVTAQDQADSPRSSTATFTVIVLDENDHGPVFANTYYEYTVPENVLENDFLTVQATDEDESAILNYNITTGDAGLFGINSLTGSLSLLTTLDYETKENYILTISAIDIHQIDETIATADTTVFIHVENTANGAIRYYIVPPNEFFTMLDEQLGVIVTKTNLKKTTLNEYILTVVAYDGGVPPLNDTALVIIQITDREREKPVFEQNIYRVSDLKEEQPAGTPVMEIHATAPSGDQIDYHIVSGSGNESFRIESQDSTGFIYTTEVLDREVTASYILIIEASLQDDMDAESGKRKKRSESNIAEVIIELEDINDNPPMFTQSKYIGGVNEDASPFTDVLKVWVLDADEGPSGEANYSIKRDGISNDEVLQASYFQIDRTTGLIETTVAITEKAGSKYEFTVVAEDNPFGEQRFMAQAEVSISVINKDNKVVLVADVPPTVINDNIDRVLEVLEEILNTTVVLEKVGSRQYGDDYEKTNPSQTDILFYAIDENGKPMSREEIMRILAENEALLNELFSSFLPGKVVTVRPPETAIITRYYSLAHTDAALISLACILFVLSFIAIIVIWCSWKQYVYFSSMVDINMLMTDGKYQATGLVSMVI
uniref:Protocadherin-15-like n=1 Tax=Saccoglossus kowalevskii TaxID=10224 RepID=A0ABM0LXC9_SACKO|nr:PREDICTED: protocadherin-15-like [Saccoglossus kowalevskii]